MGQEAKNNRDIILNLDQDCFSPAKHLISRFKRLVQMMDQNMPSELVRGRQPFQHLWTPSADLMWGENSHTSHDLHQASLEMVFALPASRAQA